MDTGLEKLLLNRRQLRAYRASLHKAYNQAQQNMQEGKVFGTIIPGSTLEQHQFLVAAQTEELGKFAANFAEVANE